MASSKNLNLFSIWSIFQQDRNRGKEDEAQEKFKKVGEAYEVISNPEKRSIYDRYGKSGLNRKFLQLILTFLAGAGGSTGGSFKGFGGHHDFFTFSDAESVFRNFFGGKDPFSGFCDEDDDFMNFGFREMN